jgi:hypothetical protein
MAGRASLRRCTGSCKLARSPTLRALRVRPVARSARRERVCRGARRGAKVETQTLRFGMAGGAAAPAAAAERDAAAPSVSKPRKRVAKAAADAAGPVAADAAAGAAPAPAKKPRVRAPRPPKGSITAGGCNLDALPDAALSDVLAVLPLDVRARAACVCRRWRALVALIHSTTISTKGALSCRLFHSCAVELRC